MPTLAAERLVGYGVQQKQAPVLALPQALFRIGGLRKENFGAFWEGVSGRGCRTSPVTRPKLSNFCWRAPPRAWLSKRTG
jgi:hypothetical protein